MPDISTAVSSQVYYQKIGQGPCLVLIHGFPESGNLWRKITDALSAKFTLLIPDMPGSGRSQLQQDTNIAQMADIIKAIMDNEGITSAVVAGHSMGGYIAFEFAARYPSMLKGLSIIHSIPTADDEERKRIRLKSIDLIQKGGKLPFLSQMIPNLFGTECKQNAPEVIQEQLALTNGIEEKSLVNYYHAMIGRNDNSTTLNGHQFPLHWVIGADDNIINYKKILEFSFKSRINFVTFIHNGGHMSMLEHPERLSADLTRFVNYCYER